MANIGNYPAYNPYTSGNFGGDTAGNPALESEQARSKRIQAEGLRMSNDATQDSNVKSAAEKRR